jgi:hypothetical protein
MTSPRRIPGAKPMVRRLEILPLFISLWRSGQMVTAVGGAAFRYGATIMLISIFVSQTD